MFFPLLVARLAMFADDTTPRPLKQYTFKADMRVEWHILEQTGLVKQTDKLTVSVDSEGTITIVEPTC